MHWGMDEERKHLEDMLCRRFHFFVVVFTIVLAGAAQARLPLHQAAILWLGFMMSTALALTIYRAHFKLQIMLEGCKEIKYVPWGRDAQGDPHTEVVEWRGVFNDPTHPAGKIEVLSKTYAGRLRLFSVRRFIGWIIPFGCCVVLLAAAILSTLGYIPVTPAGR